MPRKYFINPYTFVSLDTNPVLKRNEPDIDHLWIHDDKFTGRIDLELTLITPAVIPGRQKPGSSDEPGEIETYTYRDSDGKERLSIPGSRLRGYIFNLMRTINSSPVTQYEDRMILKRDNNNHKKGFVINDGNSLMIQEVRNEILVIHQDRTNKIIGQDGCEPAQDPVIYDDLRRSFIIPTFDCGAKIPKQGQSGTVYWHNPQHGQNIQHKKYLSQRDKDVPCSTGRWVKFPAWSGQDRDNCLKDIGTGNVMAHRNSWHLVDLNKLGQTYDLSDDNIKSYERGVDEMSRLIGDRSDPEESARAPHVLGMKNLEPGTFVYFELDKAPKNIKSLGCHYRYLSREGTVKEKVYKANGIETDESIQPCLVKQLAGWANNEEYDDIKGMKSRLWFEMAMGPRKDDVEIERKNLRILSSQPPKAHNFYLEGGDYSTSNSKIRGRKFYWHDPFWKIKMWDNEDLDEGDYAFENPTPKDHKKQWSNAEIIMATTDNPVTFCLTVRAMNLTRDERNLLLTSLVGFGPECLDSDKGLPVLGQSTTNKWCHKIGHARPFMGSAIIRVTGAQEIGFDKDWKPSPAKIELNDWMHDLNNWQKDLKGQHLSALKRVMRFAGAYEADHDKIGKLKMTYPLGQKNVPELTWRVRNPDQPKTYHWFTNNRTVRLPEPLPNKTQALEVRVSRPEGRDNPPRAVQRNWQGPVGSGAMAQAMRRAEDTKRRGKGRKR